MRHLPSAVGVQTPDHFVHENALFTQPDVDLVSDPVPARQPVVDIGAGDVRRHGPLRRPGRCPRYATAR